MDVFYLMAVILTVAAGSADIKLRNRLYGKHIFAAMHHIPPVSLFVRNSTGHIVSYSGVLFEQFDWLSKRLHFTYTIYPIRDNVVGRNINGTFTGVIGQIAREEFDISLGPFAPTLERYGAIEFVVYNGGSSSWLVVKYPESRLSDSAVFEPYNVVLWILWFSSMVAVATMALMIVYFREKRLIGVYSHLTKIDAMIMYLLGTISGQGGYYRTENRSIRFMAAIWCFTAFFFINIYNSVLTSRLSAHYQYPDIKSLDDLANNPRYRLATLQGSTWEIDFMSATSGSMGILGERYRKCSDCSVRTVPELMRKPLQGNYIVYIAYFYATGFLEEEFRKTKKCQMTLGNINYGWQYSFMGIRRHSPYIEEFHRESLWAQAFGFSNININWPAVGHALPPQCTLKYNSRGVAVQQFNVPIKLKQIFPAFVLLLTGIAISLLQFIGEHVYFFFKRRSIISI